jgi:Hemerythrin HHE cation binding domain
MPVGNSAAPSAVAVADDAVLSILRVQHAEIRDLLADVGETSGVTRQHSFDVLRELLALHESAEELVLRPASRTLVPEGVTPARKGEERQIADLLARLEKLDVDSAAFAEGFERFGEAVTQHLELEEIEEFPGVEQGLSASDQQALGRRIAMMMALAPPRPHPAAVADALVAQRTVGPFVVLRDRAVELLAAAGEESEGRG